MQELSLHILDIAKNSVKANASLIEITLTECSKENTLTIEITDNGSGMSEEFLKTVKDPFSTTRTTRRVGMGLSLFEAAAIQCGGKLDITSKLGVGTKVTAVFTLNHIDRAPIGDMPGTITTLIGGSPDIDFVYRHKKDGMEFVADTRDFRAELAEVPLDTAEVLLWIGDYINEGINKLT